MNVDPSGRSFIATLLIGIIVGAVVGGALKGYFAYSEGARGWDLFGAILGGAIMGAAMGAVSAIGGAAGFASIGISSVGFGLSTTTALSVSLGIGIGAGMLSYAAEYGIRSDREFSLLGMILSGASGGYKALSTFGLSYLGGRIGLFTKSLSSKQAPITAVDFMRHVIDTTEKITVLQAFVYSSQALLGNGISRFIWISGLGSLFRWIIDKGMGV